MGVRINRSDPPIACKDVGGGLERYWYVATPNQKPGFVTFPQQLPNGKWRANGTFTENPDWIGPEFDTPEECAQWLTMMEATQ